MPPSPTKIRGGEQAPVAGVLAPVIRKNSVFLGGSSMGKGFRRAARYYLRKEAPLKISDAALPTEGFRGLLNPGVEHRVEEPFYVLDIGVVISQFYQWKQYFPRVEVFYAVKVGSLSDLVIDRMSPVCKSVWVPAACPNLTLLFWYLFLPLSPPPRPNSLNPSMHCKNVACC